MIINDFTLYRLILLQPFVEVKKTKQLKSLNKFILMYNRYGDV